MLAEVLAEVGQREVEAAAACWFDELEREQDAAVLARVVLVHSQARLDISYLRGPWSADIASRNDLSMSDASASAGA